MQVTVHTVHISNAERLPFKNQKYVDPNVGKWL